MRPKKLTVESMAWAQKDRLAWNPSIIMPDWFQYWKTSGSPWAPS